MPFRVSGIPDLHDDIQKSSINKACYCVHLESVLVSNYSFNFLSNLLFNLSVKNYKYENSKEIRSLAIMFILLIVYICMRFQKYFI